MPLTHPTVNQRDGAAIENTCRSKKTTYMSTLNYSMRITLAIINSS